MFNFVLDAKCNVNHNGAPNQVYYEEVTPSAIWNVIISIGNGFVGLL